MQEGQEGSGLPYLNRTTPSWQTKWYCQTSASLSESASSQIVPFHIKTPSFAQKIPFGIWQHFLTHDLTSHTAKQYLKTSWGHHSVHLLSCECKTSSRDSSSLGRSSVNGGGWYELRTEEDRQARLENCCDCLSGQYRYIPGTFKDEAEEKKDKKFTIWPLVAL